MSSWAKPGVKCVCININGIRNFGIVPIPVVGQIYTINRVESHAHYGLGVELVELPPPSGAGNWFTINHFRPLITKTQEEDVALFRGLLTGAPAGVDA